jgi:hypothetical protein
MMQLDTDNTINAHRASNPQAAAHDVLRRSAQAVSSNSNFFLSPEHQDRVAQVQRIVAGFFRVRKGMYVNHRVGRGKPFTTVKVDYPEFPHCNNKMIDAQYRIPLRELGVEVVFSKNTNSYLFRIH